VLVAVRGLVQRTLPTDLLTSRLSGRVDGYVARSAQRFGSKPALVAGGRTLPYLEMHDLCDRVAAALHEIGVRPGDRVSLYSANRWEWVVAYHAALRAAVGPAS
jgi:long-chain acyl-CoA synthetase